MSQFHGNWPIKDMIRGYLQTKRYNNHKKAKVSAEDDPADDEMSDDSETTFDPRVALEQNIESSSSEEDDDEVQATSRSKKREKPKKQGQELQDDLRSQNGSAKSFPKMPFDNTLETTVNNGHPLTCFDKVSAIFCNGSGFFYNVSGEFLEANWDTDKGTYTLHDGNDIILEAYPKSFTNYTEEAGFNDGIVRSKSHFNHWKVGYVKHLESEANLSPQSNAHACTQTPQSNAPAHTQTAHSHARTHTASKPSPRPITPTSGLLVAMECPLFLSTPQKSPMLEEPLCSPFDIPDGLGSPLSSLSSSPKGSLVLFPHAA